MLRLYGLFSVLFNPRRLRQGLPPHVKGVALNMMIIATRRYVMTYRPHFSFCGILSTDRVDS